MFIELPIRWEKNIDQGEVVDMLAIDIDVIYAFNASEDGKTTCIRVYSPESSWVVEMTYYDFKERFESIKGEVRSFISQKIEI